MKTLYITNRGDWRKWLEKNHNKEKEIWLVYYKSHTGKPTIAYDDSVEEALCFGWIDSIVKRIDDERYAQKFAPRTNTSKWSESNKQRVRKLVKQGRMTQIGMTKIKESILNKKEETLRDKLKKNLVISAKIKQSLMTNKKSGRILINFPPATKETISVG